MATLDTVSTTDTLKQAFVDQLIADKDAILSRLAAVEAAVAPIVAIDLRVMSDAHLSQINDRVRNALSGGTAALDAHVASAVDAERARIAKAVEAMPAFIADGDHPVALLRADVLAAIGGAS